MAKLRFPRDSRTKSEQKAKLPFLRITSRSLDRDLIGQRRIARRAAIERSGFPAQPGLCVGGLSPLRSGAPHLPDAADPCGGVFQ